MPRRSPTLVFSAHADTNFPAHALRRLPGGVIEGHLDNFSGVQTVMAAYFSGRMTAPNVRIELTYGEEVDMAGAREVATTLGPRDVVIVIDVTGTATKKDFVIEKCRSARLRRFLVERLEGMSYDIYRDCPDPISDQDEVEVYKEVSRHTCFLGVPVWGGDYNAGLVRCREKSLRAISEAVVRLAEGFEKFYETTK